MKVGNIYLRPLTLSDTDLIVKWRNDESVRKNLFTQDLITKESHIEYYEQIINKHKCYQFIVERIVSESGTSYNCSVPIGTVYLKNIDLINSKALMGIFIGAEYDRRQGFGKEAVCLLLQYGFMQLKLNKIYLQIICNNSAGISLYKEVGFAEEGRLREDYFRDGNYYDIIQMSILESDFRKINEQI